MKMLKADNPSAKLHSHEDADESDCETGGFLCTAQAQSESSAACASNDRGQLEYYLRDMRRHQRLSPEEKKKLPEQIRKGNKTAFKRYAEGNLGLVVKFARRFFWRAKELTMGDLVQAGNFGMLKAIRKYKPKHGGFSTYARHWIDSEIQAAIEKEEGTIVLPIAKSRLIIRYYKAREEMVLGGDIAPTLTRVATKLKLGKKEIELLEDALMASHVKSLDYTDDDSVPLWACVSDPAILDPEACCVRDNITDSVRKVALAILDKREQEVIFSRLFTEEKISLESLGKKHGVTRERVRQIEHDAIRRLAEYFSGGSRVGNKNTRK